MRLECDKCDFVTPSKPKAKAEQSLRMHKARNHKGMQAGKTGSRARFEKTPKHAGAAYAAGDLPTIGELLSVKRVVAKVGGLNRLELCLSYLKKLGGER